MSVGDEREAMDPDVDWEEAKGMEVSEGDVMWMRGVSQLNRMRDFLELLRDGEYNQNQ